MLRNKVAILGVVGIAIFSAALYCFRQEGKGEHLLNECFDDLTNWDPYQKGDAIVEIDPSGKCHMENPTGSSWVGIWYKTKMLLPESFSIEIKTRFAGITSIDTSFFGIENIYNGIVNFSLRFADSGIFFYDVGSNESILVAGPDVIRFEQWQDWKITVEKKAGSSVVCNIYANGKNIVKDAYFPWRNTKRGGRIFLCIDGVDGKPNKAYIDYFRIAQIR